MKKAKILECCWKDLVTTTPILRSVQYIVAGLFVEALHATL